MAKRKRRITRRKTTARNPRRHSKRVSRVVSSHRRRSIRRRRTVANPRRRRVMRRRNPAMFGQMGGRSLATMVAGGLVGVAATRILPGLLPASIKSSLGGSAISTIAITVASAYGASMIARKVAGQTAADSVLFGGLMMAGSQAISAFMPSLSPQFGISGMGDIVPGWFAVPQNPVLGTGQPVLTMPMPAGQGMGNMKRWGNMR